jgi:hypothetical protein
MASRDKNFNLTKTTKRLMATLVNAEQRNQFKNMMIEAQIIAMTPPPSKKQQKQGTIVAGIEVDV